MRCAEISNAGESRQLAQLLQVVLQRPNLNSIYGLAVQHLCVAKCIAQFVDSTYSFKSATLSWSHESFQ